MPDRIVRAGILTSEPVNQLSWGAEVFYRRLMNVADDYGRYDGRLSVIRGQLYALQIDRATEAQIDEWIIECHNAKLVLRYIVNGKTYLEIAKFDQRIRSAASKWPTPLDTCEHSPTTADNVRQPPTNAPVVVVVCEDVVEDGSVCGDSTHTQTPVSLSIAMRAGGINTQPADPRLIALAEQGVTAETVTAACEEAKRAKPNETVSPGYVFKILERWAADAAQLKVAGAKSPQKSGGAWWATDSSILAMGLELKMTPRAGEQMQQFKGRIQGAIDNNGKPPEQRAGPVALIRSEDVKSIRPEGLAPLRSLVKVREQA